jgi:hypothetical protein
MTKVDDGEGSDVIINFDRVAHARAHPIRMPTSYRRPRAQEEGHGDSEQEQATGSGTTQSACAGFPLPGSVYLHMCIVPYIYEVPPRRVSATVSALARSR